MRQRYVSSWWRQWTCVGGTCAPAAAPPRNDLERALDTYTNLTAPFLRGCCFLPVVAAVVVGSLRLGVPDGLWLAAAYFLAFGGYCLANFARCREAHCVVTGWGWLALGVIAVWSAIGDRADLGILWDAFAVIAVVGFAFEAVWANLRGTHALQ